MDKKEEAKGSKESMNQEVRVRKLNIAKIITATEKVYIAFFPPLLVEKARKRMLLVAGKWG